jgi:hypothetical protein
MEYRLVLQPVTEHSWPHAAPTVLVGMANLDPSTWHGPDDAFVVPELPAMLRTFAEQIESAITTGPDPEEWLETADEEPPLTWLESRPPVPGPADYFRGRAG